MVVLKSSGKATFWSSDENINVYMNNFYKCYMLENSASPSIYLTHSKSPIHGNKAFQCKMSIKSHICISKLGLAAKIKLPDGFSWGLGGTMMGLGGCENICDSLVLPVIIPGPELCLRFQYNSYGLGKFQISGKPSAEVTVLKQLSKQLFRGLWNQLHFLMMLDGFMLGWLNETLIFAAKLQMPLANLGIVRLSCYQNESEHDTVEKIDITDIVIKSDYI
jgi:hypothetical protein